jgi:hypothetical protein
MAASVEFDQTQVNRLLLDLVAIGERHGIRFPRECFSDYIMQDLLFTHGHGWWDTVCRISWQDHAQGTAGTARCA